MNPRKPTKLKLIKNTYRRDQAARNEAQPEAVIPDLPEHLSEEAKTEWLRVSQELHRVGLLSSIDRAVLAAYCECWSDWVEASRMCATTDGRDKKVIKTDAGNFVENPYFSIKKRSAELMHKFAVELGMSPAARSRINVLVDEGGIRSKAHDEKNYA